jgi:hypothetical protein
MFYRASEVRVFPWDLPWNGIDLVNSKKIEMAIHRNIVIHCGRNKQILKMLAMNALHNYYHFSGKLDGCNN